MRKFALLIPVLLASGCSLAFVERPPDPQFRFPGDPVQCTDRSPLPFLDGVAAGLYMTAGIASYHDDSLTGDEKNAALGIGLLWGGLLAYSALDGAGKIRECREAKAEYIRERIRQQADSIAAARDTLAVRGR